MEDSTALTHTSKTCVDFLLHMNPVTMTRWGVKCPINAPSFQRFRIRFLLPTRTSFNKITNLRFSLQTPKTKLISTNLNNSTKTGNSRPQTDYWLLDSYLEDLLRYTSVPTVEYQIAEVNTCRREAIEQMDTIRKHPLFPDLAMDGSRETFKEEIWP